MKLLLANFAKMIDATGGLAKVTCNFANEMINRGHEVFLVHCDEKVGKFFYQIDNKVRVYNLNYVDGNIVKMPLYMKMKREILRGFNIRKARSINDEFIEKYLLDRLKNLLNDIQPDVIIASQPLSSMVLLLDLKVNIPVINMSHGDPEDYFHTYPTRQVEALDRCAANQVLVPSFKYAINSRFPNNKVAVIGNVVPQYAEYADLEKEKNIYKVIFVGQITKRKRPHLAIEAFSKIASMHNDWVFELWGEEENKKYVSKIKKMIDSNGMSNCINLKGTTDNIEKVLDEGDIFVFPSAAEGFGLALAEAMSKGLPVIGYRSCSAVNEIIRDGQNGFLCADGIDDFAEKLDTLMNDQKLRCLLGKQGREDMKQYSSEKIWDQWEQLIKKVN